MATGSKRERTPGVWELRVSLGRDPITGKARALSRTIHTTSSKVVDNTLRQLVHEAERGRHYRAPGAPATVAELLTAWLDHICDGMTVEEMAAAPEKAPISPKTAYEYRALVARYIDPAIGHLRLAKLTTFDVDGLYRGLLQTGKSRATVRKVHNLLSKALDQAVDWSWLEINPARRAKRPVPARPEISSPKPEIVIALIEAAAKHKQLATYVFVAASTGARRGELCGLRWTDIDLPARTMTIRHAAGKIPGSATYIKDTKTHAGRTVTMDTGTAEALRQHLNFIQKRARDGGMKLAKDAHVFSVHGSLTGSKPWEPPHVSRLFRQLCAKAGVAGVRLHDLRHFVGTQLEGAGLPLSVISKRLGHARQSTTSDMYVHALDEGDRDAARIIGEILAPKPIDKSPKES